MNKPQATYTPSKWDNLTVGLEAIVCCTSHPVLTGTPMMVITSPVVAITEDGFETNNTVYKKD